MCDSDKKDSFTIGHALKVLDEGEDQAGYKYFQDGLWLNLTEKDINNRKWTAPGLYRHLFQRYSKKMNKVHPDKGGKASTETFMLVKKGWDMLKKCHSSIIDLTQDSDDDIDDLDDPSSVDDGVSDDARQNESEDDKNGEENVGRAITSHCITTDNSSEHDAEGDESDKGEHRQHDGGQHIVTRGIHKTTYTASEPHGATGDIHAGGTAPSKFAHMLGGKVEKVYWFMGTIETIWVDKKEGALFRATFDDNDVADYTLEELHKLPPGDGCGDGCGIAAGNPGYKFWKGFPLLGVVTNIHYANHNQGKPVPCSYVFPLNTPNICSLWSHSPHFFISLEEPIFQCEFHDLGLDDWLDLDEYNKCRYTENANPTPKCKKRCQQRRKNRLRNSCGNCANCLREKNCGKCKECLDMPLFGGRGKRHKKCLERVCCDNNKKKKSK